MTAHFTRTGMAVARRTAIVTALILATATPASYASEIIAFGDAGHSSTGDWTSAGTGFNEQYQTDADNGATSTHDFTGLANDTYYVWANWTAAGNRTGVAQYDITDGGGLTVEDQTMANGDLWADGSFWTLLDTVTVTDGDLSVAASDMDGFGQPGETVFLMSDAIRIGTHAYNETLGGGRVVDNGGPGDGFSFTGSFSNQGAGYMNDEWYQSTEGGAETATFSFTGLDNGTYTVSAIWTPFSNRTTDAVYSISDGGGDVHVDQRFAPSGMVDEVTWQLLHAAVVVTDGTLEIVLSDNDPNGFLMVDAVRIGPLVYYQTADGALVVDNGDPSVGFSHTGAFTNAAGYLGDEWFQTDPASDAADTATFSFVDLENGEYSVSATWSALFNRTADAVFSISDGGGDVQVNQQVAPNDFIDETYWELLHEGVTVTDGTLDIVLTDSDLDSYLMVDAVRIKLDEDIIPPAATIFYTADFEDGEINPGRWPDSGVINTTPYSATQPEAFLTAPGAEADGDAFGWQNRASNHVDGDTTIIDTEAYTGENCAAVENRTLRSDIVHTLKEDAIYHFTFWYYVPSGMPLTFVNKVVCKDQTNDVLFVDTGNDDYITAPAHDTWFGRTVSFDTTGYAHAGETIDLRFGVWFTLPGLEGAGFTAYTDNWSVGCSLKDGFNDVSQTVGLAPLYNPTGVDNNAAWGDYNNDGLVDLYLSTDAQTSMFRNDGAAGFTEIGGVGPGGAGAALWVDYDNDGWVRPVHHAGGRPRVAQQRRRHVYTHQRRTGWQRG